MTNSIRFPLLGAVLLMTTGCGAITDPDFKEPLDTCKLLELTNASVASVSVTPTSLVLTSGTSAQISATVDDPKRAIESYCAFPVTWMTADTLVASVAGTANKATIRAGVAGQTVITLWAGDKTATIKVTVTNPAGDAAR